MKTNKRSPYYALGGMIRMRNGGVNPGDPKKESKDAYAEEFLRRKRMGMYPDAGEGAAAELARIREADRWGLLDDEVPADRILRQNSEGNPIDELYQMYEGLKSWFEGDGYKRGYNDEYIRQTKERADERMQTHAKRNPNNPWGHFSSSQ